MTATSSSNQSQRCDRHFRTTPPTFFRWKRPLTILASRRLYGARDSP
jgi:hypothetical protein